jgi:methionyl aminopeptidase
MNNSRKSVLIGIGDWTSNPQNIKEKLKPNPTYTYDTFERLDNKYIDDKIISSKIKDLRVAAECHREARKQLQSVIEPGMKYRDICETIESKISSMLGKESLKSGMGFPIGISVNEIAAHDSANPGDIRTIKESDVVKIDIGVHVNGNIIDSAFMIAFDDKYKPLLDASKDGTWTGIRLAGPDVHLIDISYGIQEVIESYEIELDGKIYPIKAVKNLGGHNILPYNIHAGKILLSVPDGMDETIKMSVNECYAIETFATTGDTGKLMTDMNILPNHYSMNTGSSNYQHRFQVTKKLQNFIKKQKSTLPFCTRWLDSEFGVGYSGGLKLLTQAGIVTQYPALVDKPGTYTSQWEHTIYLHDYGKEVLSQGDDY